LNPCHLSAPPLRSKVLSSYSLLPKSSVISACSTALQCNTSYSHVLSVGGGIILPPHCELQVLGSEVLQPRDDDHSYMCDWPADLPMQQVNVCCLITAQIDCIVRLLWGMTACSYKRRLASIKRCSQVCFPHQGRLPALLLYHQAYLQGDKPCLVMRGRL
jgi:hypothetical protein